MLPVSVDLRKMVSSLWKASSVFVGGDYPDTLLACCHAVKLYMVMTFDLLRIRKQYLDFRLVIMICSKS